jgi:hypothetical protein
MNIAFYYHFHRQLGPLHVVQLSTLPFAFSLSPCTSHKILWFPAVSYSGWYHSLWSDKPGFDSVTACLLFCLRRNLAVFAWLLPITFFAFSAVADFQILTCKLHSCSDEYCIRLTITHT